MNSKQFAWVYLIKNGKAGVKQSYYGGWDYLEGTPNMGSIWEEETFKKINSFYIEQIKKIGIDWEKTFPPQSDIKHEFNGTFSEDSRVEYIEGKLCLKNGETQEWISEAINVTNVFNMMEEADKAKAFYYELTNEHSDI